MNTDLQNPTTSRAISAWLIISLVLVIVLMIVGALTRLTDSGLSIPDWSVIMGVVPPLSQVEWDAAFEYYKSFSEYQLQNSYFTLEDFKRIFWWEYAHRLLARVSGLFFAAGLLWFVIRRQLSRRMILASLGLLLLGAAQGVIGYWMVKSGLVDRVDVAPLRLAIHLYLALALAGGLLWLILPKQTKGMVFSRTSSLLLWSFISLLLVTIGAGALTAGADAGYINNSWPLFSNGSLLTADYDITAWLNQRGTIQSNHRNLAYLTAIVGIALAVSVPIIWNKIILLGLIIAQVLIGIVTVVSAVALHPAIIHQGLAISLFMFALFLLKAKVNSSKSRA